MAYRATMNQDCLEASRRNTAEAMRISGMSSDEESTEAQRRPIGRNILGAGPSIRSVIRPEGERDDDRSVYGSEWNEQRTQPKYIIGTHDKTDNQPMQKAWQFDVRSGMATINNLGGLISFNDVVPDMRKYGEIKKAEVAVLATVAALKPAIAAGATYVNETTWMAAVAGVAETCAFSFASEGRRESVTTPITSAFVHSEGADFIAKSITAGRGGKWSSDMMDTAISQAKQVGDVLNAGIHKTVMKLDKFFGRVWDFKIDELATNILLRSEFIKYAGFMLGGSTGKEATVARDENRAESQAQFSKFLNGCHVEEIRKQYALWEKKAIRDPRKREYVWSHVLETVRQVSEKRDESISSGGFPVLIQMRNCFTEQGGKLNWDEDDCERAAENLRSIRDMNKPCVDIKWASNMKRFRKYTEAVEECLYRMVSDDRDIMRTVTFGGRNVEQVRQVAKDLQTVLANRLFTLNGKHVSEEATNAIERLVDTFVTDVQSGNVTYEADQSKVQNVKGRYELDMYGMWRIACELNGKETQAADFIRKLYMKARVNGGFIETTMDVGDTWEDIFVHGMLQHGICAETHRIFHGSAEPAEVVERMQSMLGSDRICMLQNMLE